MTVTRQPNKLKGHVTKGTLGLFISPDGHCFPVEQSHIYTLISDPSRFGLNIRQIKAAYTKHNEPVGIEGAAREEILRGLVMKGWIRLRRYVTPREQWSITVGRLDDRTRTSLKEWAGAILAGTLGYREDDPYKPVEITSLSSRTVQSQTVEALARGCFRSSNQL
ncbi:MAG: hypothetical protein ACLP5H_04145 [Desulfomonilaceae bacterium]